MAKTRNIKRRQSDVINYMTSNPDRLIPLSEFVSELGIPNSSLGSVISRLRISDPRYERVRRGLYRYNTLAPSMPIPSVATTNGSTTTSSTSSLVGECVVYSIVRDHGDKMLVEDENGNLFSVHRIGEY